MKIGVPLECIRCKNKLVSFNTQLDTFECFGCTLVVTLEFMADQMGMTRGAFSTLFAPGLRAAIQGTYLGETDIREIERVDNMAILHPDTSEIPIWRRRPTRVEHPMLGWRAWGMRVTQYDDISMNRDDFKVDAVLTSVAADCEWDGPVLRSHKRPVDPKYWDELRKKLRPKDYSSREYRDYQNEMHDTFNIAGVWSVKTQKAAVEVAKLYGVSTYGSIKMWGRVAQFRDGYRAEVCMINELWLIVPSLWHSMRHENSSREEPAIKERIQMIATALENRYQCKVNLDHCNIPRGHRWP